MDGDDDGVVSSQSSNATERVASPAKLWSHWAKLRLLLQLGRKTG